MKKNRMIRKKMDQFLSSQWTVYIVVSLLMMIVFCCIFGIRVLNPTYTEWLMKGQDLSQHYLGWKSYRAGRWMFPIGCTDQLSYPDKMSIIFTDSIPCFAVLFKILSPIMPNEFQYFGLWGIMCFVLQGVLSARIISHFTQNKVYRILAGCLFGFIPVMLWRMYTHTALAGQWIILLALETVFACKAYAHNNKIFVVWAATGLLASSTHIYFIAMCGIVLVGYCIADIIAFRRIKRSILAGFVYLAACIFMVSMLGGFSSGVSSSADGLGIYSMNLNAFFNPQGWSCIYQDRPLHGIGQYEGFAYLGAGCIFLLFLSVLNLAGCPGVKSILLRYRSEACALFVVSGIGFLTALSPVITFGNKVLLDIPLPAVLYKCWSVFRASGRIIWIMVYIIVLCTLIIIYKTTAKKRMASVLLLACLVLQIYDLHDTLLKKNDEFSQNTVYETPLKDKSFWDWLGNNKEIEHVYFVNALPLHLQYAFADWTSDYGKKMNRFYFARPMDDEAADKHVRSALEEADGTAIFVFLQDHKFRALPYDLNLYSVDGVILGYAGTLEHVETLSKSELMSYSWIFSGNQYLQNGQDHENGIRSIYSGGLSYGPYWNVAAGQYRISITGKNLHEIELAVYSQSGAVHHDFTVDSWEDESIVLLMETPKDVEGLEITIRNIAQNVVELSGMSIQYIE